MSGSVSCDVVLASLIAAATDSGRRSPSAAPSAARAVVHADGLEAAVGAGRAAAAASAGADGGAVTAVHRLVDVGIFELCSLPALQDDVEVTL